MDLNNLYRLEILEMLADFNAKLSKSSVSDALGDLYDLLKRINARIRLDIPFREPTSAVFEFASNALRLMDTNHGYILDLAADTLRKVCLVNQSLMTSETSDIINKISAKVVHLSDKQSKNLVLSMVGAFASKNRADAMSILPSLRVFLDAADAKSIPLESPFYYMVMQFSNFLAADGEVEFSRIGAFLYNAIYVEVVKQQEISSNEDNLPEPVTDTTKFATWTLSNIIKANVSSNHIHQNLLELSFIVQSLLFFGDPGIAIPALKTLGYLYLNSNKVNVLLSDLPYSRLTKLLVSGIHDLSQEAANCIACIIQRAPHSAEEFSKYDLLTTLIALLQSASFSQSLSYCCCLNLAIRHSPSEALRVISSSDLVRVCVDILLQDSHEINIQVFEMLLTLLDRDVYTSSLILAMQNYNIEEPCQSALESDIPELVELAHALLMRVYGQ